MDVWCPRVLSRRQDATLKIGRFCSIADGVRMLLGGDHRVDWVATPIRYISFLGKRRAFQALSVRKVML